MRVDLPVDKTPWRPVIDLASPLDDWADSRLIEVLTEQAELEDRLAELHLVQAAPVETPEDAMPEAGAPLNLDSDLGHAMLALVRGQVPDGDEIPTRPTEYQQPLVRALARASKGDRT
ncbi:MAG: hypothetical protein ACRDKL_09870 [Solirubrobacteraceae bacterium]